METVFENTTIQTKEILRHGAACIMRKKLIVHAVALAALGIAFLVFVFLKGTDVAYFFGVAFSFACIAIAIFRFDNVPRKFAERTYSDQMKLYKEPATVRMRVRRHDFTIENFQQNSLHTYAFKDCVKRMENKAVIVLKTVKKTYIILDKNGFIKGDTDALAAFLRKQGVR